MNRKTANDHRVTRWEVGLNALLGRSNRSSIIASRLLQLDNVSSPSARAIIVIAAIWLV
jgi:hypothetical protein